MRAKFTLMASFSVAILAPQTALAQSSKQQADSTAETDPVRDDIVVTAQRREQRLMDVPASVTAVSNEQLVAHGVMGTIDLQAITPGLQTMTNGFSFQPFIRGIGSLGTSSGDEANVGLYIDNVYMPYQQGNAFNFKSVERVEVLKGPQGTLFGRNATGGAIRIITRNPGTDPQLEASANYGARLNSIELSAIGSTPISSSLGLLVEGYYLDDDGYVRNVNPSRRGERLADTKQTTGRAKLVFDPSDGLRLTLAGDYTDWKSSVPFTTTVVPTATGSQVLAFKNVRGVVLPGAADGRYSASLSFRPYQHAKSGGASLTAEFEILSHKFTSISAWRTWDGVGTVDTDRTNLDISRSIIQQAGDVYTQEVIANSDFEGPISYTAGLFYINSEVRALGSETYSAPLSPVRPDGLRDQLGPSAVIARTNFISDTESFAAFAEATWQISNALTAIAGYRYTTERRESEGRSLISSAATSGRKTFNNSTVRATLQYRFSPDANAYVTYSTGFKSGVFNATSLSVPMQLVRPEKVKAWEAGIKARLGPADVRLTAFDYSYDDIQLQVNNILNPSQGTTLLFNAASATIRGTELEAGARLAPGWQGQVGISWIPKARYDEFLGGVTLVPNAGGLGNATVVTDLSGSRMARTPRFTIDVTSSYEFALASGTALISASYYHNSGFRWIAGDLVGQRSYDTVNARLAWTTAKDAITFSLWGRNLTKAFYYQTTSFSTAGFVGSPAQPREIGFGVTARF